MSSSKLLISMRLINPLLTGWQGKCLDIQYLQNQPVPTSKGNKMKAALAIKVSKSKTRWRGTERTASKNRPVTSDLNDKVCEWQECNAYRTLESPLAWFTPSPCPLHPHPKKSLDKCKILRYSSGFSTVAFKQLCLTSLSVPSRHFRALINISL